MYGKIFESMYEGTLYGQWEAIVTMQQLIVIANEDGVVDMTPPHISGKTSIPLDIIEKGLEILAGPDKYSRTPGNDGARIALIDEHRPWGWYIVNYKKYRDMVRREDKKKADRERAADRRKANKNNDVAERRTASHDVAEIAHTDTNTDTDINISTGALNVEAWQQYLDYRKERGASKLTAQGEKLKIAQLANLSLAEQQACVELTISNGWTGLFPEKQLKQRANRKLTYAEQLAADMAEKGI